MAANTRDRIWTFFRFQGQGTFYADTHVNIFLGPKNRIYKVILWSAVYWRVVVVPAGRRAITSAKDCGATALPGAGQEEKAK